MRATVEKVQRASTSWSGNPTVRVTTDQGVWLTRTDSHSGLVALELDEGDVVDLTIVDGRIAVIDVLTTDL